MDNEQIAELKRLEQAASPRGWSVGEEYADNGAYGGLNIFDNEGAPIADDENRPSDADAKLMVALRNAAPELIALAQRATEAKPSASAAPGIDSYAFRKMVDAVAPGFTGCDAYYEVVKYVEDAIAAAREEEIERCTGIAEMRERYWLNKNAEWEAEMADLRARLAAPEGEAVARILKWAGPKRLSPEMSARTFSEYPKENCAKSPYWDEGPLLYLAPQAKAPQQPPAGEDTATEAQ
jgi:hypothetical protein